MKIIFPAGLICILMLAAVVIVPSEMIVLGEARSNKVVQVMLKGTSFSGWYLVLRSANADDSFSWHEQKLPCSLDSRQDFFKTVESLEPGATEDFLLTLNDAGACESTPASVIEVGSATVRVAFNRADPS